MGTARIGRVRPVAEVLDIEQRARQLAQCVIRNLVSDIFQSYPELGIERAHAIVEDAARDA